LKLKKKMLASSYEVLVDGNNDDKASFCGDSSSDESSMKKTKKVVPKKNAKKCADDVSKTGRKKGPGRPQEICNAPNYSEDEQDYWIVAFVSVTVDLSKNPSRY
jgi:hypothetical protein